MSQPDPALLLREWASRAEHQLERALPAQSGPLARLGDAMRHAALGGGKRLRPCLVYASGRWGGASDEELDHAAVAVELIHVYSLIHDDLPAMDDDALRRGKPTVHIAFDEATAILAGDALQSLAFEQLARAPLAAGRVVDMLRCLAEAAGWQGMCGGQAIDIQAVGATLDEAQLRAMHACKTGALIRAAVRLGGLAAGGSEVDLATLDRFSSALGLAFQIKDDLLDVESDSATLGKTAGKDAAEDKPTYVSLLGAQGARARLAELGAEMRQTLGRLGGNTAALEALATLAIQRRH